jgi:hypothetical protein
MRYFDVAENSLSETEKATSVITCAAKEYPIDGVSWR